MSSQLVQNHLVASQIDLGSNNETGHAWAVMVDLREPLLLDVFERGGGSDGETDEEHVCLGVTQGSQSIVIFLASCVKESECVGLITDPGLVRDKLAAGGNRGGRIGSHGPQGRGFREIDGWRSRFEVAVPKGSCHVRFVVVMGLI